MFLLSFFFGSLIFLIASVNYPTKQKWWQFYFNRLPITWFGSFILIFFPINYNLDPFIAYWLMCVCVWVSDWIKLEWSSMLNSWWKVSDCNWPYSWLFPLSLSLNSFPFRWIIDCGCDSQKKIHLWDWQ